MALLKLTTLLALLAEPVLDHCNVGTFSSVVMPSGVSISIQKATPVPENGNYGEGSTDLGFPGTANGLPELCAVTVSATNNTAIPQSKYRFGLFLPDKWNSKLLTIGSYSFAGGINWPGMGEGTHYQMATLLKDNGHNSNQSDLSWATPATLFDWGYRAMHGSVQIGELLTEVYYMQDIHRSYYSGCSIGGRQGLKEIQVSPESFDGALIGAPAWGTKYLMPWITKIAVDNLNGTDSDHLGIPELDFLASKILALCDEKDGCKDNIVSWPEQCNLDFSQLLCSGTTVPSPPDCLTAGQIKTANKIYGDYVTSDGTFVHNGFELSSETQWNIYLTGDTISKFDADYERYFLYNNTK